jgi:hypothetical protein
MVILPGQDPVQPWHEEVVLRFPQHAALIYIIIVPDMHGQKADTGNYQIAAAAPGGSLIDSN